VIPIVEDGTVVGLVTDRDLVIRVLADRRDPASVPLREIATRRSLLTISPDATVAEAREMMGAHQVKRLLVTKDDAFVSVITSGTSPRRRNRCARSARPSGRSPNPWRRPRGASS
jgi:CBS domain-containing protein